MQRYQQCFQRLQIQKAGAFVPFVTLADPTPEQSLAIVQSLIDGGADALELGFPFSDPVADGPTIQKASLRALKNPDAIGACWDIIKTIREHNPDIPIGLLLYSNLVFAKGIDAFYAQAKQVGVDSILVADAPIRESKPFRAAAKTHDIAPIFIATPNASDDNLRQLASYGRGYTYVLGRAGVTGTEVKATIPTTHLLNTLKQYHAAPGLVGFGISTPEQVKAAIQQGAAGAISGSAVVNIIEQYLDQPIEMQQQLQQFVAKMKAATS